MAGMHAVLDMSWLAGGAITQWTLVELTASETVTQVNAVTDQPMGVCQESITAGDATNGRICLVRVLGVTLVKSGGSITRGALLRPTATGTVQALAGVAGTSEVVVGIALDDASSGDLFEMLLTPGARQNTAVS
jgi:hypothetical protein